MSRKKKPFFKNFDLYIDANPKDTIKIKFTTIKDTKETIKKLERLRKGKKYTFKRIKQVAVILMARLRTILKNSPNAKSIKARYNLALKYHNKLKRISQNKP